MLPKLDKKRYLITAALPYANGSKHIGHLAGAYIPADIYARYLRLRGKDTLFVCGSDEHGTAIANQAIKEKKHPKEIVDKYHHIIKDCFEKFNISFDIYHRTGEQIHHKTSQDIFSVLLNNGFFEAKTTEQYFDNKAKQFLADRYIKGTCPHCKHEEAYGDQCEKCGASLSPTELISPLSTLSNEKPILKKTKHWYMPLEKYEEWLQEWILKSHKEDWKPNVYGQCKSWIDAGLHSRSATRDLDWGIPVPVEGAEGKVLYVWFDAPIGYISATKQWAIDHHKNWEDYWKSKDTELVHFIGKDNIVFHCIIFPIILHALGNYILPENVPANEFLNLEGDKMSTSRGWSIEMEEYLETFPSRVDELRYVLTSILPETGDSEFTWEDYKKRVNNELVSILGNLVHRTWILMHKYFEGKIIIEKKYWELSSKDIKERIEAEKEKYHQALCTFRFKEALQACMNMARIGNKYLTDEEPWKLFSNNPQKTKEILLNTLYVIKEMMVFIQPFLPDTSEKLRKMFAFPDGHYTFADIPAIEHGSTLSKARMLFEKLDDDFVEKQKNRLNNKAQMKEKNSDTQDIMEEATIAFSDFEKVIMKVGQILEVEKVKNTDRLLHFKIDIGNEVRDIVSGIAEFYNPAELINEKVIVLTNLESRKIRGIESKGMLLTSESKNGKVFLLKPNPNADIGSLIS